MTKIFISVSNVQVLSIDMLLQIFRAEGYHFYHISIIFDMMSI